MTTGEHARILGAYVGRLTIPQAEAILASVRAAWNAGANLGTSAQAAAMSEQGELLERVCEEILRTDRAQVERILARSPELPGLIRRIRRIPA